MHARTPLCIFVLLATVLSLTPMDVAIARALFFDSAHDHWIGSDSWWVNTVLHTGGRRIIGLIVVASLCTWIAAIVDPILTELRRPAAYLTLSVVLSVSIVGWLKSVTNVDCPWDLVLFGGRYPFVPLFADRPDMLRLAHCFPAAHASAGYSLMALYFVFLERSRRFARFGLMLGLGTGLLFGFAQQSRGAHFVSHDLWSATIAWLVALTLYACVFQGRVWDAKISGSTATRIAPDDLQGSCAPQRP